MEVFSKGRSVKQALEILFFEIVLSVFVMPISLYGAAVCLLIFFAASFAAIKILNNKSLKKEIKALPLYSKAFAVLIDIRLAYLFYSRWLSSDIIKSISVNGKALLFVITMLLAMLSAVSVLILFKLYFAVWNKIDTSEKRRVAKSPSSENKTKKRTVITATLLTGVFWLSQCMLTLWQTTDNYKISLVLNQLYSDENYCLFLNPMLSFITKLIDGILPAADGFVLLTEILMLVAIWCILYVALVSTSRKSTLIILYVILLANYDINLLHSAFTVTATVLSAAGFFLVYSYIRKKVGLAFAVTGCVLFAFGCMWRFSAALILIPYAGLIVLADLIENAGKKELSRDLIKKLAAFSMIFIVIAGGLNAYNQCYISKEQYEYASLFNGYRSSIYDYHGKSYDEIGETLSKSGISENDYALANELILMDTDVINADYLKIIFETERADTADKAEAFFEEGLPLTWYILINSPSTYIALVALSFCAFVLLAGKGGVLRKLELLAAIAGTAVIILYFTFSGHLPKYLIQSILIYCWLAVASIFLLSDVEIEKDKVKTAAFLISVAIITFSPVRFEDCYIEMKPINATSLNAKCYEYIEKSETDAIDSDENAVFIWSVIDRNNISADFRLENSKLFSNDYLKHNILDGEWTYGQPYFNDLLSDAGIYNPVLALAEREHTYYISGENRCNLVLTYIREHYYPNAQAVQVGEVYDIPVWEFVTA